jgi:apolipoprotein D and lipocalin family protein
MLAKVDGSSGMEKRNGDQSLLTALRLPLVLLLGLTAACVRVPEGIEPVRAFDLDRYLGTWFEIARLDHRFERGLDNVSARYERSADGSIRVVNRGFARDTGEWDEAVGKAHPAGAPDEGYLKVSFFGPFYAAYVVFELERTGYQYAFITSSDRSYLWLLSRTPKVSDSVLATFRARATALGFDLDELIIVDQSRHTDAATAR